jgi:hypothetical protein
MSMFYRRRLRIRTTLWVPSQDLGSLFRRPVGARYGNAGYGSSGSGLRLLHPNRYKCLLWVRSRRHAIRLLESDIPPKADMRQGCPECPLRAICGHRRLLDLDRNVVNRAAGGGAIHNFTSGHHLRIIPSPEWQSTFYSGSPALRIARANRSQSSSFSKCISAR